MTGNVTRQVSDSVQVHDKYQFEVKFSYPLGDTAAMTEYRVETYLFIPNNLCVNRETYSREEFFNDMQKYVRFKTPVVLLRAIDDGADSPLEKLSATLKRMPPGPDAATVAEFNERIRMFCSVLKSALRDEEAFIERSAADVNFPSLAGNYLETTGRILGRFRQLKLPILVPTVPSACLKTFELADEFLSLTANKYRYRLVEFLQRGAPAAAAELRRATVGALRAEIAYREACRYPSLPDLEGDNEAVVYRESALKKIMASVLFLRTSSHREGRFLEHVVFGSAAGLAMAFATGVALLSRNVLQDASLAFFLVMVVAYVFKDRIKDVSRAYLSGRIRERLYDYHTDLFSALGRRVGYCRESMVFVRESAVPRDIARLRNRDYIAELENGCLGEDVILARKQIRLYAGDCADIVSAFHADGVVDITRFNVRRFLEKMDNPTRTVWAPRPAETGDDIVPIKARRVYHVNLVMKFGMVGREDQYRRFRLVLSRNGIRRIEELGPDGPRAVDRRRPA